jgi:GTP cyclohydrolase II
MTEILEILENSIDGPILDHIQLDTDLAIAAKQAKKTEALKRAKAKYYQSIKEKPEFLERIAKNSKIYYDRHKDEPEFKAYKIQHVKAYQEKNKEYYANLRHERRLKEVVEKLEDLGFERIAEILIANKKVKMLDTYDSINVSE